VPNTESNWPGRWLRHLVLVVTAVCLGGCSVGPDYVRPTAPMTPDFKEAEGWKIAEPQDAVLRGTWWAMFDDPQLSDFEQRVSVSNQNLMSAEAQFRQARTLVWAARSAWYPTAAVGVSLSRSRQSANLFGNLGGSGNTVSDFTMPLSINWEIDVWGRIRRLVESNTASAQATAADVELTRLSLQAELAVDYFQLRALDAERELFDRTVAAYQKSLQLTQNRYAGGIASRVDVVQAQTQLETTSAQAIDLAVQRAQLEHAIAVLIGEPPAVFSIPVSPLAGTPPPVPVGVPSELLERRPDVAAGERLVSSANAQIGVAEAAYYPMVTISAAGGFESSDFSTWFTWPSRFWSVGPTISETVYDGGLRYAQTQQARAAYDSSVALYRQNVLTAFQEVEDNLAALRILRDEADVQDRAVAAARESAFLETNRYKEGTASYLEVVITQATELANERTAVDILGRRMAASVRLIQALGGGWNASDLPSSHDLATTSSDSPGPPGGEAAAAD
jgi:NodT family efflux transporter outer membrane factor (OMF) lipoprotein